MVSKYYETEKDARETKPNQMLPLLLPYPSINVYCFFIKLGEESRRVGSSSLSLLAASMGTNHGMCLPSSPPYFFPAAVINTNQNQLAGNRFWLKLLLQSISQRSWGRNSKQVPGSRN